MPPMRKSPSFVAKKNLSCSTCSKPYASQKTLATHVNRVHNKPNYHDDVDPVPKTTSAELDNVVNELNLENSVLQTAAEEAEDEHEAMANLEDDDFEDVPQHTSNITNEANTALRRAERRVKAGEMSKADLRKALRQAEKTNKKN